MKTRGELEARVEAQWRSKREDKPEGLWTGPAPLDEAFDEIMDAIACMRVARYNDLLQDSDVDYIVDRLFEAMDRLDHSYDAAVRAPKKLFP